MIRVALLNSDDKVISVADLSTATELQQVVEQARNLIRDCERLAYDRNPRTSSPKTQTPYLT
jgi:hypothetical protein